MPGIYLSLAGDAARRRMERRYTMLAELDRYQKNVEGSARAVRARDIFYEKAHSLIKSPAPKRAFDVNQEPDLLREQFGRSTFGQSCLLARRLIQAGVHFVTVTDGGWDTHQDNFKSAPSAASVTSWRRFPWPNTPNRPLRPRTARRCR